VSKHQVAGERPEVLPFQLLPSVSRQLGRNALRQVSLAELRPTQAAVGMRAVEARKKRLKSYIESKSGFERYLEKRPIPVVLGPSRMLYAVDRHHLSLALVECGVEVAYATVLADLSAVPRANFWTCLERNGMLHPYDGAGNRIHPSELPRRLRQLGHDPYRDLAWSVRQRGGFEKSMMPFSEFRWADFFRKRIPLARVEHDYATALRQAMTLANTRPARSLPGYAA